jgi:exopolysaccharide production protein ExoZ
MISNLQVLRGLAALAVVFYHTAFVIPGLQHTDFQAVCVFFVISGFIMTCITRETAKAFLAHRLIRIVPLYWIATIFYVTWTRGGFSSVLGDPSMIYRGPGHFFTTNEASLIFETAQSLLFVPRFDDAGAVVFPVLGVGWTLNLEMYFYVLFSVALLISRRFAPLLVAATLWTVNKYSGQIGCNAYCSFYAHGYVTFFTYGIAVFYAWRMLAPLLVRGAARYFTIAGSIGIIGCFAYLTTLGFDGHLTDYHMAAPPALVLALLLLHSAGVRCDWRPAVALGAASYALYLTHFIVIETLHPAFDYSTSIPGMAIALVLSVAFALFVHREIEQPLLRLLHGLAERRPKILTAEPAPGSLR